MTQAPDSSEQVVKATVLCARCGYDLHGLSVQGVCPECSAPVKDSMRGDLLRYSDPLWLRQVARGLRWVHVSRRVLGIGVLGILMLVLLGLVLLTAGKDTKLEHLFETALPVATTLVALVPIGIGIGLWMLSAPEPRHTSEHATVHTAMFRVVSALAIPALAFGFVMSGRRQQWSWPAPAQQAAFHACIAVVWMHMFLLVRQAMMLEVRCEASDSLRLKALRGKLRNHAVALILCLGLYWIGWLRWRAAGGWTPPTKDTQRMFMFATVIGWFSALGTLISMIGKVRGEILAAPNGTEPAQP